MSIDFQKELNSEQLDVVLHGDGPCLVLAGAGSGKTRTITYRVAYLLEQGVAPENILLVTFTNKAAAEMVSRMQHLTGRSEKLPWAGTFHSIGHRILRRHAEVLGYQSNFSILDSDDSESLVKLCAKDYPSSKGKKFPSAGVLQSIISFARNAQMPIAEVLEARFSAYEMWSGAIESIAAEYDQRKKTANSMDFDDLLTNWLLLLDKPEILKKYSEQFKYILVDEYQDTNKIQAAIVCKLAQTHQNILAVGDDAQSIYSFRAADIENILRFEKVFPQAKIFKLTTNYRSSQEILSVANSVIAQNPKQYKKDLKTILKTGVRPELRPYSDNMEEASEIASKIASLIRGDVPHKEIAVLFRAAHHSQQLELELMRYGIDYDYRGGLRFFERSHVKDVLAYLRVFNNLADMAAWMRVLLFEDGVGPGAAGKIVSEIENIVNCHPRRNLPTGRQGGDLGSDSRVRGNDMRAIGAELPDRARAGWNNFLTIWDGMLDIGKGSPTKLINSIINSSYRAYLEGERLDSADRIDDIKQLAVFAGKYDNLEEFLAEAALQEAFTIQNKKKSADKIKDNKIILSTIHQAKGLEWTAVFVINLANGAFPHSRALLEEGGVEEERRLFYVAVTRAKKYLYFSYPMALGGRGGNAGWGEQVFQSPSQFLDEIRPGLITDRSLLRNPSTKFNDGELTYEPDEQSYSNKPLKIKPGSFLRDVEDL